MVETKVKENKAFRIRRCLPNNWQSANNYSFSQKGRIWIAWDPNFWTCQVISSSAQQITVDCLNKGGLQVHFTVVYAANYHSQRVSLWKELVDISVMINDSPWAVLGDFNSARFTSEKIGGRKLTMDMLRPFNECLDLCGLSDIRSFGGSLTWNNSSHGSGRIAGRLDRMLGNGKWIEILPNSYYIYLKASTSDHSPILLSLINKRLSFPKPFRYFNYWADCEGYQTTVSSAWDVQFQGNPIYQVIMKLKNTKTKLKIWSGSGFSSPKHTIQLLRTELLHIQESLDLDPSSQALQVKESELKKDLAHWLDMEESQLQQKSRELWLRLGDRNNKFFHASLKHRYCKNSVCNLVDDHGNAMTDIIKLRTQAPEYYNQLYNQDSYWNIFPKLTVKRKLSVAAATWLIRDVSDAEIKDTMFQLNPDKAPGPDGFNARFFQCHWDVVGTDVCKAIRYFFKHKKLVRQLNHTFLTLVPKSTTASSLNDFRPIACCNLIYKLITKILANRLQMVINDLISLNQSAFLKGRQISDCSLLAHELIRDFNNPMGSRACMKIDLRKAFDSVNREFIYYILHCMGFPYTWIEWIQECISTPTFSVMVDGSPAGFFHSNRGIRQGDPLSPYLFVIAMEFWSISMDLAVAKGTIHPLKRGSPNQISHLLFADDMLVFCRADKKSLKELGNLFDVLKCNTGLSINKEKSKVFFSKGCKHKTELADVLGCSHGALPVKYLGLPLSINYVKPNNFGCLFDKLRSKIEGWMTRVLSFAGRVELAKSVLLSSLNYWIQTFRLPFSVIRDLERLISNFIWKGGMHACSWDTLCKPKNEGGVGLRKVKDMTNAAGVKLLWRLVTSDCLWAKWMRDKYLAHETVWHAHPLLIHSGTYKFILSSREFAEPHMILNTSGDWLWSSNLTSTANHLSLRLAWQVCRLQHAPFPFFDILWHPRHCPKWSYCLYRALLNKLPTRDRLFRFGIIEDTVCVLCRQEQETNTHLFFDCQFTKYIWSLCKLKLGFGNSQMGSISEEAVGLQLKFKAKDTLYSLSKLLLAAAVWNIWQERNRRIFQNQELNKVLVFRRLYDDIHILMRTCHWKTCKDSTKNNILSNWS